MLYGDPSVRDFAIELFVYSLYKDGFNFTYESLAKFAPTAVKIAVPKYNDFLNAFAQLSDEELKKYKNKFLSLEKRRERVLGGGEFHYFYDENLNSDDARKAQDTAPKAPSNGTIKSTLSEHLNVFNFDVDGFMLTEAEKTFQSIC